VYTARSTRPYADAHRIHAYIVQNRSRELAGFCPMARGARCRARRASDIAQQRAYSVVVSSLRDVAEQRLYHIPPARGGRVPAGRWYKRGSLYEIH